jgi:hypothetical protein
MTFNSQTIIPEIRAEFNSLIEFVTNEQALTATANQIERGLFRRLLSLGAKLLTLFFATRSQACSREPLHTKDGRQLPYHRDSKRNYLSIFGKVAIWRPYFYQRGVAGECPLDAELSLGEDSYSDMVREISEYLGVDGVYHKTTEFLERFLGLRLSTRVMKQIIDTDAADVEAYYAQKPAPAAAEEAEVLVIQADGKGVPIIMEQQTEQPVRLGKGQKRGRKKEAVVTTAYTIAVTPRTPKQVVASFFDLDSQEGNHSTARRPSPQNKHIWATLDGKDAALDRLEKQVSCRDGPHIQHRVALCDGCEALQNRLSERFRTFVQILDFIHADEYLWDVANALLGETNEQRIPWMIEHTTQLLSGQAAQLVDEFKELAKAHKTTSAQRQQLLKTAGYFERNLPFMDYHLYLAKGWPIASGVIEGACRHFVKDRCELSGMRWTQDGAEHLLRLRAVAENDDWDAYHRFRRRQRHTRLYQSPFPESETLEMQALAA